MYSAQLSPKPFFHAVERDTRVRKLRVERESEQVLQQKLLFLAKTQSKGQNNVKELFYLLALFLILSLFVYQLSCTLFICSLFSYSSLIYTFRVFVCACVAEIFNFMWWVSASLRWVDLNVHVCGGFGLLIMSFSLMTWASPIKTVVALRVAQKLLCSSLYFILFVFYY